MRYFSLANSRSSEMLKVRRKQREKYAELILDIVIQQSYLAIISLILTVVQHKEISDAVMRPLSSLEMYASDTEFSAIQKQ